MKKLLAFLLLSSIALPCFAWQSPDYTLTLTSNARTVQVSTIAASPTTLLTYNSNAQRTYIINTSTFTIFISSVAVGISTNSVSIPGTGATTNAPVVFNLDSVNSPFIGNLFGFSGGSTAPYISIFQTK